MKVIVIAAIARNGVIGRTSKACEDCCRCDDICRAYSMDHCDVCAGTGCVPCNDIPWSYPEHDAHVERETMGHAVIMGRRTWESPPAQHRPLKGRTNVVISTGVAVSTLRLDGSIVLPNGNACLREWLERAETNRGITTAYIIGGAKLYAAALPLADELDLTLIDRDYEGDVRFPGGGFDPRAFARTDHRIFVPGGLFELVESHKGDHPDLTFTRWCRR